MNPIQLTTFALLAAAVASALAVTPLKPTAATASSQLPKYPADIVPIYLNKSGFNLGKPKRFTAPTLADDTRFIVRPAKGGVALAQGVIRNHKGDFSSFNPDGTTEYVVEAGGLVSVPFRIGPFWLERVTYQGAVDFMIDSRHHVGNERAECRGSFGWRDDTSAGNSTRWSRSIYQTRPPTSACHTR